MDITATIEAESKLVGSILRDGRIFPRIVDIIDAEKFHSTIYKDVFSAMTKVHNAGLIVDAVTVGDQLQREGVLDSIKYDVHFGRGALSKLRDTGTPKNAESYAYNVQDYYGKRQYEVLALRVAEWSRNGRRSADIFTDARRLFDDVYASISTGSTNSMSAKNAASLAYDEAVAASQGNVKFARTGIIALDKWFRMREKNLTIIAARPGQGKTALLVTIALNNARYLLKEGKQGMVLFLSMEMSVEEVTARFLSQLSEVPTTRILDGQMTVDEWDRFNDAIAKFEKLPIVINDLPALTINQIRNEARMHLKDGEDNLLIVDYLQLASSGEKKINRVDEVGAVARGLKIYAQEKGTPVLAAAQLSRAIEQRADKRPVLSDLRESGNIEQDANNVIFLYQKEGEDIAASERSAVEIRKIIVAKQRNGPTSYDKGKGDIDVQWNGPIMRFENVELFTKDLN